MRDYKFGTRIYNLRKGKGLSQSELGALLGVTNKAVSKWENGEAKPAINQLMKLSKLFDVSMDDIINSKEEDEKGLELLKKAGEQGDKESEKLYKRMNGAIDYDKINKIFEEAKKESIKTIDMDIEFAGF